MKWSNTIPTLTQGIDVLLLYQIFHCVQSATLTCIVKRSPTILTSTHWVTASFIDQVLHCI
ncbi:hypothetical protein GBAR_LOCUS30625 [Geodia barretti]|uniref:Uncharacterized protein n=1 Tax=Geodia barretti TaxID=519541 RepID=A0AA35TXC2_GEOBA|nr:hypothetical protein GBAR_LOCUS30625 [Geodia barretti]CAI8056204.1 hypothetical protein GBAR_LOCUS30625 [Geodia barretti]